MRERALRAVAEAGPLGVRAEEPVERDRLGGDAAAQVLGQPGDASREALPEAGGGLPRRRGEGDAEAGARRVQEGKDAGGRVRLARPRPTGHQQHALPKRGGGRERLLV